MKTVHLIGNAHLDPVWLWSRGEGVDAVLATARSACDRLKEFGEFVFTCSSSWFHQTIERHDPRLFARVRRLIRDGRWQIVGGTVIEPDCNFPSAESFARQLDCGQEYFRSRFERAATVGYNVDSFGHTAYLPRFLREAGLDAYVFMRPGPHERPLPSSLFRWRSPDAREVLAFRIAGGYGTGGADLGPHVQAALDAMGEGIDHTMVFFGVGDHGGGPTRAQIAWALDHAEAIDGARLLFSHPRAFFDAVAPAAEALPVVVGELQHHAIGCYSVERRIKVAMRRAEARLAQAQRARPADSRSLDRQLGQTLDRAWEAVLFNQFHDVLGGTSTDDASRRAAAELAGAEAAAEEVVTVLTRRGRRRLADPKRHHVVAANLSDEPFEGFVIHEPFFEGHSVRELSLVDEAGRAVPYQLVEPRAKVNWIQGVLFRLSLGPGGSACLTVRPRGGKAAASAGEAGSSLCVEANALANDRVRVECEGGQIRLGGWTAAFVVQDDPTDTWSHSAGNRFDGPEAGRFEWRGEWEAVETGPLRAAARREATFDRSRLWCRLMVYEGEPAVHLHLSVVWSQARQLLRLVLAGPEITRRCDWVPGGPLDRPTDGLEYPTHGVVRADAGEHALAAIAPEVFSAAVEPRAIRLTLLRSPYVAHHDPAPAECRPDQPVTDQGRHEFDVVLWPRPAGDMAVLARVARQLLAPPVVFDLTG